MPRRVDHVLHDILEAIGRIEDITRGKTLEEFEASWRMRWLVQRAIEIISEASRAVPEELTRTQSEVPWPSVRGIGNILRHDYDSIADPIIWRVVTNELPKLKRAVEALQTRTGF
jgi:uncharacterized protein with HEPN domain